MQAVDAVFPAVFAQETDADDGMLLFSIFDLQFRRVHAGRTIKVARTVVVRLLLRPFLSVLSNRADKGGHQ